MEQGCISSGRAASRSPCCYRSGLDRSNPVLAIVGDTSIGGYDGLWLFLETDKSDPPPPASPPLRTHIHSPTYSTSVLWRISASNTLFPAKALPAEILCLQLMQERTSG